MDGSNHALFREGGWGWWMDLIMLCFRESGWRWEIGCLDYVCSRGEAGGHHRDKRGLL